MFRFKLLYFKSGRKNKLHSEYNISHFCKRFSLFRHCRWRATHILFKFSRSCQWSSAQKLNSDSLSVWMTIRCKAIIPSHWFWSAQTLEGGLQAGWEFIWSHQCLWSLVDRDSLAGWARVPVFSRSHQYGDSDQLKYWRATHMLDGSVFSRSCQRYWSAQIMNLKSYSQPECQWVFSQSHQWIWFV